jgi:hypothetical protein
LVPWRKPASVTALFTIPVVTDKGTDGRSPNACLWHDRAASFIVGWLKGDGGIKE